MIVKRILAVSIVALCFFACKKDYIPEQEPNDSYAKAMSIEPGKEIKGFLQTLNDRDLYRITVESDSILDVNVTGVKGINAAIRLWEIKEGEGAVLLKTIDDNRKSSPERFANLYARPGTYYIEIAHGGKDVKAASAEDFYLLTCALREPVNEEMEPNDDLDNATPLFPGTEMTGYYSPSYNKANSDKENPSREEDWYALNIEVNADTPVMLDLVLTGVQGINSVLTLYDASKKEIARADSAQRGSGEEIKGIGIKSSGNYYIMVTGKNYECNNDDPYTLTALIKESDPSQEMEPNNDIESASTIINGQVEGIISGKADVDYYCYRPVDDFGIYRVRITPDGNDDFTVAVYSTKKTKLFDINNGGPGKAEVYPNFKSTDEFFIAVSSRTAGTPGAPGAYELSVTPLDDVSDMELEPNDIKGEATKFSAGKATGFISRKGDKDFYLLEFDARINAAFDVTGVKGGELKISVTDPLGYIIKTELVKGQGSLTLKEMIDKKAYIIVESSLDNYENPYTIQMRTLE